MIFPQDLKEFLQLLNAHCVEFCIVGGYAVGRHGFPRYTGDLDVLILPTRDNAERVLASLNDFGFGNTGVVLDDFLAPGRIMQMGIPPLRIDIITGIDGVTNEEVFANCIQEEASGLNLRYIGLRELLRNKQEAGRDKDLIDVKRLKECHQIE